MPCWTDERAALQVLVIAGLLPYKKQSGFLRPLAEDRLRGVQIKGAAATGLRGIAQGLDRRMARDEQLGTLECGFRHLVPTLASRQPRRDRPLEKHSSAEWNATCNRSRPKARDVANLKRLIAQCADEWNADNAPRLSAALAFYSVFSLSPIVVVVVSTAGLAFGRAAAAGQLAWELHDIVGWQGATAIQGMVNAAPRAHVGVIAAALSILAIVFGASSVVVELRSGLNTIWHVPIVTYNSNLNAILQMGKERFYSFALVTAAGLLLLISVGASTWMASISQFAGGRLPLPQVWLRIAAFVASYIIVTFLFAAIYRVVPDVRLQWADVIIGAAVTGFIFTAGKQLIALYMAKAAFASAYGAAGSFVLLLVWVYYSAQLFFLGAEFTKVYARTYGSHTRARLTLVQPKPATETHS